MARNFTKRGAWWKVRSGLERIRFFLHNTAGVNSSSIELCGIYDDFEEHGAFSLYIVPRRHLFLTFC